MRSRASASSSAMRTRIGFSAMRCSRSKIGSGVIRDAQRGQDSASRGGSEGEGGWVAVELIEACFGIAQSDALAGRRQTGTVVLHGDHEIVAVDICRDRHFAASRRAAGAMLQRVFDDRL